MARWIHYQIVKIIHYKFWFVNNLISLPLYAGGCHLSLALEIAAKSVSQIDTSSDTDFYTSIRQLTNNHLTLSVKVSFPHNLSPRPHVTNFWALLSVEWPWGEAQSKVKAGIGASEMQQNIWPCVGETTWEPTTNAIISLCLLRLIAFWGRMCSSSLLNKGTFSSFGLMWILAGLPLNLPK